MSMSKHSDCPTLAYRQVAEAVEAIRNDEPSTIAVMSAGDVVRQGDLYLVCLDEQPSCLRPCGSRQLAPGDTRGSRHVAEGDCEVYMPVEDSATRILNRLIPETRGQELFIGPVVHSRGEVTIAHPEHGDRTLPGDSTYLVVYQRTWAEEIRRQQD